MSKESYDPLPAVQKGAHIDSYDMYKKMYDRSISDPAGFWAEKAREMLHWYRDFDIPCMGDFIRVWLINGSATDALLQRSRKIVNRSHHLNRLAMKKTDNEWEMNVALERISHPTLASDG